jgi:UDP-2,3-diacylglucosamine pyrophosphatase LpxH
MELFNDRRKMLEQFHATYEQSPQISVGPGEKKRFIIFSDHHRGDRGYTDYFQRCEKTYNAALGHYMERDFHLVLLGDVEEFWEFHPRRVMNSYPLTYDLEREFFLQGRLTRIRGNHDSLWQNRALVEQYLGERFPGLEVVDGLRLRFEGPKPANVFLAHGHQGSFLSDTLDWFSMFWFRTLGSRIIHPFKRKYQTPAHSYRLREEHDTLMFECAEAMNAESPEKIILVCGHTHHPIFMSRGRIHRAERTLEWLRRRKGKKIRKAAARLRSQYEYMKADFGLDTDLIDRRSLYFNTGCCSFDDGSITGIEISKGKMKLVKWTDESTHAERILLGSEAITRL